MLLSRPSFHKKLTRVIITGEDYKQDLLVDLHIVNAKIK